MSNLKVSLVIPAYNEEKCIGECLQFALDSSKGKFYEIIVVDNASTDKTSAIAEKFSGVRVAYESSKGITHARQRGFEEAKGDIIAFIDADTRMPDGWYEKIMEGFKDSKTVCLSGPYIYYDIPAYQKFLVKLYWYVFAYPIYLITRCMNVGGNFAIRRDTLVKMGGFDTNISFYGEDTNTARRACKFGKVNFRLDFFMYTSGRRLFGQGIVKTALIYGVNFFSEIFIKKPVTKQYKDIR